ncbi:fimbrial biogenesis chaperone [Morganella morganii]|uniref:fimbrial biogenesis chaperone n=1 Tax=Morganella morganii TaxID=582 RepID=UPI00189A73F8|nr:fimbria/pilus periplasmic chaperone [Morganella morganii]
MLVKSIKVLLISSLFSSLAYSGVIIEGTRIIFEGGKQEQVVRINNRDETQPALIQVWADDGINVDEINNSKLPFVITPPISRIEPGKGQSIRVIYNGMTLPQDKESVYYFNVLEIPAETAESKKAEQRLDIAFKTRIKLFYRPEALAKSSNVFELDKLKWSVVDLPGKGTALKVENPSPFYISITAIKTKINGKDVELRGEMVAPMSSSVYVQDADSQKLNGNISDFTYAALNDYGSKVITQMVKSGSGFTIVK